MRWLRTHVWLLALAAAGSALSLGAFALVGRRAVLWHEHGVQAHATRLADSLADMVGRHVQILETVGTVLADGEAGRAGFAATARTLRPLLPTVRRFAWVVPRGAALVVEDVTPSADGDGLVGVDLRALAPGQVAAAGAGRPMALGPLRLPDGPDEAQMLLMVPSRDAAGRAGLVAGMLPLRALLDEAFGRQPPPGGELFLLDASAPSGLRVLAAVARPGATPTPLAEVLEGDPVFRTLWVGGRQWVLILKPSLFAPFEHDKTALIILAAGLALTAAVVAHVARGRAARAALAAGAAEKGRIAEALAESERRFRLALDASRLTVYSQDRELRYTWGANLPPGMEARDFLGRRTSEFLPADDAARVDALKRKVMETGEGFSGEVRTVIEGRPWAFDLRVEPLRGPSGEVAGLICAAADVTEDRAVREALQRARLEAVRASEAKSRFLAAASHDLRQPFQAMGLLHTVLSQRLTDAQDRHICERLGEAMDAGRQLLNSLLEISTLDAGLVQPRIEAVPCRPLLDALAAEFSDHAAAAGVELRVVACEARVHSDPVLLERMLRNLLDNAIRHAGGGRVLLGCRRHRGALRFEVCDDGPGIPTSEFVAIFEDFYQLCNPERDRAKGLGLGLSAVDRMARLLGHEVSVRSRLGAGSVFAVTAPLAAVCPSELAEA